MLTTRPCSEEGCGQHIAFLKTATGSSMPVDAESLDANDDEDTEYDSTRHVAHWGTCAKPDQFRRHTLAKPKTKWMYLRLVLDEHELVHELEPGAKIEIPLAIAGDRVRIRYGGKTIEAKLVDKLDNAMPVNLNDG